MHNHARHKFHHQASFSSINFLFFAVGLCGGILFNCTALKIHLCKTLQLYNRDFKIQRRDKNVDVDVT